MSSAGLIVQKYGGTSVGTPDQIIKVASRIADLKRKGEQVVVVVSAMGHTTDELIQLARRVTPNPHSPAQEREMDMLLSAGERVSMSLLSMALRDCGQEAISFTGSQAGIITDESHTRAQILEIRPMRVQEELARGRVVIVAGFQGVSRTKEVTTLGRGGSDTTAVALAAALKAVRCEILTDVAGIFSADPRVVPSAKRYEELPLELVHEMAIRGAQVMHPPALEIAIKGGFPLYVGLSHSNGGTLQEEGTMLVPGDGAANLPEVLAVTSKLVTEEVVEVSVIGRSVTLDNVLCERLERQFGGLTRANRSITVRISTSNAGRTANLLHQELVHE